MARSASPEKTRPSVFWFLGSLVVPVVAFFAKVEVIHPEKLPERGAFVLAPNHNSEFDPLLVAVVVWRLGRAPRFMTKESLFRVPVLGWALRATGMVPVSRSSTSAAARETLQSATRLVENGQGVIVYPEGSLTRDPDLWPMRGKTGAVRLALAGGLEVIPCAHWGVQEIMPRYGKLRLRPRRRVQVVFGDPVDLSSYRRDESRPASLAQATDDVMQAITALLAGIRGTTPPSERWRPSQHGQTETGRLDS